MICGKSISEKLFSNPKGLKAAFLDASKWLATNIIAKGLAECVTYRIEKMQNKEIPTVKLSVFVMADEGKIEERHCTICQEMSRAFYINSKVDCERCALHGYKERINEEVTRIESYVKEKM